MNPSLEQLERHSDIQLPDTPKRDAQWIFLGDHGLRAGWGVLLFAAVLVSTQLLFRWMLHPLLQKLAHAAGFIHGANPPMPLDFILLIEVPLTASALIATAFMARIEHKSPFTFGFQGRAGIIRFVSGLICGFLTISAFVGVLAKAGLLHLDGQLLHGTSAWLHALGWGVFFLIVALFEEALFRGYLQYTLTRGIGFWWGALLINFLFGFSHGSNAGETPVGLISAGGIGLVLCLTLWYTGSLWWALGFHAAWDWGESYFYGTSDSGMVVKGHLFAEHPTGNILWSGGLTGPEGSLLVMPLLAIIALCVWLWWRNRTHLPFKGAGWRPQS
jgi:membrane protease YdiL (CAAX protease family)